MIDLKKAVPPMDRQTLVMVAVSVGFIAHALFFNFLNDDAFISFRYADNLVRHGELVFNPGERVEGYTNFLWTVLMAGVLAVGLDPAVWSRVLGIAFAVVTLWILTKFVNDQIGRRRVSHALPSALLAMAPSYACWATGGLETQLFTLLTTGGYLSFLSYVHPHETQRHPHLLQRCAVLFALAAMTRPEGMLVAGLVLVFHVVGVVAKARRLRPYPVESQSVVMFLVLYGGYMAWRWWYYGWPLPNTYYVKAGAGGLWAPGMAYFLSWVIDHQLWCLPLCLAFIVRRHTTIVAFSISLLVLYTLHVVRVGGDFMGLHRFLVPTMPIVALVVGLSALEVGTWLQERIPPIAIRAVALSLLIGFGVQSHRVGVQAMQIGSEAGVDRIGWLKMFHGQCESIGKWLAKNAHPDSTIATTAAGIIPYYSRLYTVDILGLNDEWIAHNVPARGQRPGHTKSAPLSYLLSKDVDYMIYHPTISSSTMTKGAGERRFWGSKGYMWRTVEVPNLDPPLWGFWQRQGGVSP